MLWISKLKALAGVLPIRLTPLHDKILFFILGDPFFYHR